MSLIGWIRGPGANGFGYDTTAEQALDGVDLSEKTFLLTGCNSGLGFETVRVLALKGARVMAAARTEEKARAAIQALDPSVQAKVTPVACDLSEPASVRACVDTVSGTPLDGIICNAGIMALPRLQTKYGLELQFLTNHMGHFILVTGLLEQLAPRGRVVVLGSNLHKSAPSGGIEFDNLDGSRGYAPWRNYGHSKLANVLFARGLAKRFADSGRTANAVHPGVIFTRLNRHMGPVARFGLAVGRPLLLKNAAQGAATQCWVAGHPDAASISGRYFADCNPAPCSRHGADDALAERLWAESERIARKL